MKAHPTPRRSRFTGSLLRLTAVSIACAYLLSVIAAVWIQIGSAKVDQSQWDGDGFDLLTIRKASNASAEAVTLHWYSDRSIMFGSYTGTHNSGNPLAAIPKWAVVRWPSETDLPHRRHTVAAVRAGWPLACVSGTATTNGEMFATTCAEETSSAIIVARGPLFIGSPPNGEPPMPTLIIPLAPHSLPLLCNSSVLALIFVALRWAWQHATARCRRPGHCRCGYPTLELPRCPECGRATSA
jgi:hypothetical protein